MKTVLFKLAFLAIVVGLVAGCTHPSPHGTPSFGPSLHVDVGGVGIDAGAGIHSTGGGYGYSNGRPRMMGGGNCNPINKEVARAYVADVATTGTFGDRVEQAHAADAGGRVFCTFSTDARSTTRYVEGMPVPASAMRERGYGR